MTDTGPVPPAPLVDPSQLDALVDIVVVQVAAEANADPARDRVRLERGVRAAIDGVAQTLQRFEPFGLDAIEPRVMAWLVTCGVAEMKRPGFAYGTAGYDDADPGALRVYAAMRADLGLGLQQQWGFA